jgi:hypothetical protein
VSWAPATNQLPLPATSAGWASSYVLQVLLLVLYSFLASALMRDLIMPPAAAAKETSAAKPAAAAVAAGAGPSDPPRAGCDAGGQAAGGGTGEAAVHAEGGPVLSQYERAYLYALVPLELYCTVLHRLLLQGLLPFLPLLLASTYCALGMVYAWARMAAAFAGVRGGSQKVHGKEA